MCWNKLVNLFFKIIGLIFFALFLESCVGTPATVHYNQCAETYGNFEDIARCGKTTRNQSCEAWGTCSSMGNALVKYADILAYGVKTGELSNYQAKLMFAEYQNEWNRNARAAQQRQSQAFIELGNQISTMGTQNTNTNTNNSWGSGTTCMKAGEYTQGLNKVCNYSCTGSGHAITVGAAQLCPLTVTK
jgi:hypothetical protein